MGILDIFRDDDEYEGSHKARGTHSEGFSAKNKAEAFSWLEHNHALLSNEDGGIIVYTDDEGKNFLNLYSHRSKAIDESLEEYSELNFSELQDLLKELDDVDFVIFNPGTDELNMTRREVLANGKAKDETPAPSLEDTASLSRRRRGEASPKENSDSGSESESKAFPYNSEKRDHFGESSDEQPKETTLPPKEEPIIPSEAPKEENTFKEKEENKSSRTEYSEKLPMEEKPNQLFGNLNLDYIKFNPAKIVPTPILRNISDFVEREAGIRAIYLGQAYADGHVYYGIAYDADSFSEEQHYRRMAQETEDYVSLAVPNDGNSLANKINSSEFLFYEVNEAKGNAPKRDEEEMLAYIENHFLLRPAAPEEEDGKLKELITFTNFTHIPMQLMMAFGAFSLSRPAELSDFLDHAESLKFVHVNPFTDSLQIERETLMTVDKERKIVLVVGLGLIGSSLALAVRESNKKVQIIGLDKPHVLTAAKLGRVIDSSAESLENAARKATHIILATPIEETLRLIEQLGQVKLRKGTVITDTASTKVEVMAAAEQAFGAKEVTFVGGHPMAGSHKSGLAAANLRLFENAYYVLSEKNESLENLLVGTHAKFIVMNAKEHDAVTSQVSHLPHVLASALVLQSSIYADQHPLVSNLAAGGFRDLTRIADSDPALWAGILLSNRDEILERLGDYKVQLDKFIQFLEQHEEAALKNFFEMGRNMRAQMEIHKGVLQPYYDLFVTIPDERGAVLKVLSRLEDYSITSIKINEENREDIHGVLQISFKSAEDKAAAKNILEQWSEYQVTE